MSIRRKGGNEDENEEKSGAVLEIALVHCGEGFGGKMVWGQTEVVKPPKRLQMARLGLQLKPKRFPQPPESHPHLPYR